MRMDADSLAKIARLAVLATVLEGLRLFIPLHQLSVAEDWVADLGGALAALTPVVIGDFRRSFRGGAALGEQG